MCERHTPEQLLPHSLARTALEQHVVGHDDRRTAVDFQQRLDVLDKVQLLVARGRPEVVAHHGERFALRFAFLVDHQHTGLLAERRVGHHDIEPIARIGAQAVVGRYGRFGLCS